MNSTPNILRIWLGCTCWLLTSLPISAQTFGSADRDQPGDEMIQAYLANHADRLHQQVSRDLPDQRFWDAAREKWRNELDFMLGIDTARAQARTPLQATVTGVLERDGYVIEKLHFQSRPGLYVTANLYRPTGGPQQRRPTVLYVCGHASRGRNGNKAAYQSHGIWFAQHGYVCMLLDTLQLGEIAGVHHGTYRKQRWSWISRGYTPAGVECWNGIRALDYLVSRQDVDPSRLAVTGISGGGATTFWIAAADDRVKVVMPVSGMADLPSYVNNRMVNGHCDCMFMHNTFRWPWARIAALIAPRPLLFVNSHRDVIFPMDANRRVSHQLERVYSQFGSGDQVDSVVSLGGHAYRKDIRRATFRFANLHLLGDPSPVRDSEVELVAGTREDPTHPIAPMALRVFPTDDQLPPDQRNTSVDEWFVPVAHVDVPGVTDFHAWQTELMHALRQYVLRPLPDRIPPAIALQASDRDGWTWMETEPGIRVRLRSVGQESNAVTRTVLVVVAPQSEQRNFAAKDFCKPNERLYYMEPRGVGATRWTQKNPPNYVERSHLLLGKTVDLGRVWDVAAVARFLGQRDGRPVSVAGCGHAAMLAAYAGLVEPDIDRVILDQPFATHLNHRAPQFLNLVRVCDFPEIVGLLAPRQVELATDHRAMAETIQQLFMTAGVEGQLTVSLAGPID